MQNAAGDALWRRALLRQAFGQAGGQAAGGKAGEAGSCGVYRTTGSNAKPMAPTCAESSDGAVCVREGCRVGLVRGLAAARLGE